MIGGIFKMVGILFAKLGYGDQAEKHNCIAIGSIFSLMIIFWTMSLIFLISGIATNDTVLCIIIIVIVPLIMTAWFINARFSSKVTKGDEPSIQIEKWDCPKCGMHNKNTSSCQWCKYTPSK